MNNIKKLRLQKGLSLREMEKDFSAFLEKQGEKSVSNVTLSRWENEKNSPNAKMWGLLAKYFNVSPDYLKGAWSKKEILKLVQDCYIDNLAYIDGLKKEQFEESQQEKTLVPLWVIAGDMKDNSSAEKLALAINDYFYYLLDLLEHSKYSWLTYQDKKSGEYTALFFRDASEPELIKQLDTLKASLSIALNGSNREIVLNDSYIWETCFSGMLNDELITNLMQNRAPKSTLEIALRLRIESDTKEIIYRKSAKYKFNF